MMTGIKDEMKKGKRPNLKRNSNRPDKNFSYFEILLSKRIKERPPKPFFRLFRLVIHHPKHLGNGGYPHS